MISDLWPDWRPDAEQRVVYFSVPGQPATWKRARQAKTGHRYTADSHKAQMENVKAAFIACGTAPFPAGLPLIASARFYYRRPAAHWSKRTGELKPWASGLVPMNKQDLSNLMKLWEDALNNGVGYHDDSQIVRYEPSPERVFLDDPDAEPRTDVLLASLPSWPLPKVPVG